MKYTPIAQGILLSGLLAVTGCAPKEKTSFECKGSTYQLTNDTLLQISSSFQDDRVIKLGLVSDLEGAVQSAHETAHKLGNEKVDAIIIAGDTYENEQIRRSPIYPASRDNIHEMVNSITPYAQLNVPIFIIPGNHEGRGVYKTGIKELQKTHSSVVDLEERIADLKGVNIVGLGGYYDPRFMPSDGFILSESKYQNAENQLKRMQPQGEPTIFVTHSPPYSDTMIDFVSGFGHVGDKRLSAIMNSSLTNIINIHGHIHEGGRNQASYKAGPALNVAAITSFQNTQGPTALVLVIKDNQISYYQVP